MAPKTARKPRTRVRSRPKGKTVQIRAYCRRKARRRISGRNQFGEGMPF